MCTICYAGVTILYIAVICDTVGKATCCFIHVGLNLFVYASKQVEVQRSKLLHYCCHDVGNTK